MPTESAQQALNILRDGSQFQWYVIPIFVLVMYVYAVEIERRNWSLVFCGLALWGMDWFNEIWNSLVFHFTQHAPVWGAPAKTAYLILIGLNIEICFMFFILGIVFAKMLPPDKSVKVFGIPNRWFFMAFNTVVCVFIEILLNQVSSQPGRRADVGLPMVERARAMAHPAAWLFPLLPRRLLGVRHEDRAQQGDHRRRHLRRRYRRIDRFRLHVEVDLTKQSPQPYKVNDK